MLKVFSGLLAVILLGGCYTQFKAIKQVGKALVHYPELVAKIALDSFPCDVIRIDTIISVIDTTIEINCLENPSQIDTIFVTKFIKLPIRTTYITKTVESTAKLTIINAKLDSLNNDIRNLRIAKDELIVKVKKKNNHIKWAIGILLIMCMPYFIRILKFLTINI